MPELSGKLNQLRPVTFHYRSDPKSVQQYGLIAEEVDKVYPELVIRDDKGEIQGVRYEELAPMLLSETQKLQQTIDTQTVEIRDLKAQHDAMQKQLVELNDLKQELHAALRELKATGDIVARR
jgi:phage shock protein A